MKDQKAVSNALQASHQPIPGAPEEKAKHTPGNPVIKRFVLPEQRARWEKDLDDFSAGQDESASREKRAAFWFLLELKQYEQISAELLAALEKAESLVIGWAVHYAIQGCTTPAEYEKASDISGWNPVHREIYQEVRAAIQKAKGL
jgi:hypothetical protein